jgi:serine/threonine-protein kinase
VRHFNELAARELSTLAGRNLAFSPDGRWLAFTEGSVLYKISVESGQQSTVAASTMQGAVYGLAWKGADSIYLGGFSGLWAVPAGGGTVTLVRQDSTRPRVGQRWPVILPGAKHVVFAGSNSSSEIPRLSVMSLGTGTVAEFDIQAAVPLGMLGEQLVYVSPAGGLMAVRFDLEAGRPIGEPVQTDEGVLVDPTGGAKASLSESGTLAYLRGRAQLQPVLIVSDVATPMAIGHEPGIFSYPRLSPDGSRMAITAFSGNATDVWIRDIAGNTFTKLTVEGSSYRPEWSADGRYVIFISTRDGKAGVWRRLADGSGPAELVYQPELEPFEAILSPDSKWLIFRTAPGGKYSRDIFAVPLTGERTVRPLVTGPWSETLMRLSPDGKWLAYQSNESNRTEVYVRPFPGNGARITVSDNGGTEAVWARNGRALFYRGPTGEIIKVDVSTGARFSIGQRRVVLTGSYMIDASHASYDVAPDGRFLMLRRAGAEAQTIVVHNWGRELREKTAPKR